jgi:transcriptional regulator with XRE-family HTH domain
MHRLTWALTQRELGILLGIRKQTVSKYEQSSSVPHQKVLISLQLIFSEPAHELFPTHSRSVVRALMINAVSLREALMREPGAASARKRRFLDDLISRSAIFLSAYEQT